MPSSNIEIVRGLYDAFLRGDMTTVLEGLSPDSTWALVGREEDLPFAGPRKGRDGAAEYFRQLADTLEITLFEPQKFLAAEDKVFSWGNWKWRMRRNGVAGEHEWLNVFTLRDGLVSSWRGYVDTAHLAAALHASAPDIRAAS
jgi:ketosteroid isomerase-like protein